jgi:hypothetical protein
MAYVYRHIRLDKNQPFYIGIGSDNKNYYRANRVDSRNIMWNRIADKTDYEVEILMDNLSWEDACKKEKEFIKLYGRINTNSGTLANLTDGGDGSVGYIPTEETRKKLSESGKGKTLGRKFTEEHKQKLREAKLGRKISAEHIAKLVSVNKGNKYVLGKKRSEEVKIRISKKMKEVAHNKLIVLDLETGIYYDCIKDVSVAKGFVYGSLVNMLNGHRKNKTSLIVV